MTELELQQLDDLLHRLGTELHLGGAPLAVKNRIVDVRGAISWLRENSDTKSSR
jgi:hypothetical protein